MNGMIVIAGNWKMHHGPRATRDFFQRFSPSVDTERVRLLVFPPAVSLLAALEARGARTEIALGVQNIHWEERGAFTGEVSAPMAAEAGATHCLIGHSERRHIFGESDQAVARKVAAALEAGLLPVVCVGETLEERRAGRVDDVILRQLDAAISALPADDDVGFMIAYEPVWAIGTGETATPEDASNAHATLRGRLADGLGSPRADTVPILYGGSVKPGNAAVLLAAPHVDGVLVGGASLDPGSFASIAEAAGSE
jgi:triosephosphate isomerase